MNIKQTELLQDQAWLLLESFHKKEMALFAAPVLDMDLYYRVERAHRRASIRWTRRSKNHLYASALNRYVINPDGFASSPALSSGALGQGASL